MNNSYICSYKRTPIGSYLGKLKDISAPKLGAKTIKALVDESQINLDEIDEVIMGNVLSAGIGQAPARQAALYAGLLHKTQCTTINKVCGSGLKSVLLADQAIRLGDANIIIAGGMENMSRVPHLLKNSRSGFKFGHSKIIDSILNDGLWDPYNNVAMGNCAETLNNEENFSREEQDQYAIESYKKSNYAIQNNFFKNEIIPINVKIKKQKIIVDTDEEPLKFNEEKIHLLKPAFDSNGSVTAANASSLNDGAAAVLLASNKKIEELGLKPKAKIVGQTSIAIDPIYFTKAPIDAIKKVINNSNYTLDDIDLFEINEAFSCVPIMAMKKLNIPKDRLNVNGGAVSLGHPIGASGCRILVTLLNALEQHNKKV